MTAVICGFKSDNRFKFTRGLDLLLNSTDLPKKNYISGQIVTISVAKQLCYMTQNEFAWYMSQQTLQVSNMFYASCLCVKMLILQC